MGGLVSVYTVSFLHNFWKDLIGGLEVSNAPTPHPNSFVVEVEDQWYCFLYYSFQCYGPGMFISYPVSDFFPSRIRIFSIPDPHQRM